MTKLIEKELTQDAQVMERGKIVEKKRGDTVSVSQGVIDSHPGLFADVGETARAAKRNTADVEKLKARIVELEKHNKALVQENAALKRG